MSSESQSSYSSYSRPFCLSLLCCFFRPFSLSGLIRVLAAGCASNGPLRNIYLLSLQSPTSQVRIGYFSLCTATGQDDWVCSMGETAQDDLGATHTWDLAGLAKHYRHQVAFVGLVLTSSALMLILGLLLATFPRWHTEREYDEDGEIVDERAVKPFPNKRILNTCMLVAFVGAVLSLVAALWQHSAAASTASTLAYISGGEVEASIGVTATVLVWLAFGICLVISGAVTTITFALERLSDQVIV
ncbi:Ca2+ regulator and membrane fusion protein Fig1-domain-containing protein [Apiosordaria backusii]|uniref:Ca2+ regulator and membrane fusion protein Fig1-domain-containing protein n=1 Tax=Apiosordaria backusii TaxID=314023 RepID=A0AA40EML8_9PEZI|nr:Ca2+ regulator and membrane fusion protein Fig1-domain-containing protein [Apiosordaria backusii]